MEEILPHRGCIEPCQKLETCYSTATSTGAGFYFHQQYFTNLNVKKNPLLFTTFLGIHVLHFRGAPLSLGLPSTQDHPSRGRRGYSLGPNVKKKTNNSWLVLNVFLIQRHLFLSDNTPINLTQNIKYPTNAVFERQIPFPIPSPRQIHQPQPTSAEEIYLSPRNAERKSLEAQK